MKNTLFSHHSGRPFGQAGRTLVHVLAEVMVGLGLEGQEAETEKHKLGALKPGTMRSPDF